MQTDFHPDTCAKVREILDTYRENKNRIRVWYGNPKTGDVWQEEYDVLGYVGRSLGFKKAPLLLKSKVSKCGGAMLDHCIMRIDDVKKREILYQVDGIKMPKLVVRVGIDIRPKVEDEHGNCVAAMFKSVGDAQAWADFMMGNRYSK